MAYQRPNEDVTTRQDAGPPDPAEIIKAGVLDWIRARKHHGPMPAPAPDGIDGMVAWWAAKMQEPERPSETFEAATGSGGTRWECGYACRCRNALLRWLDLPQMQREAICAGVLGDKVPYRCDSFELYRLLVDETYTMREIGIEAYRDSAERKRAQVANGIV